MKITVVTPTVRPNLVEIIYKCLKRQTFPRENIEWLIACPLKVMGEINDLLPADTDFYTTIFEESPRRQGDFYSLNKAWNDMFSIAQGDLIVSIVDGLWFPPDILESLYAVYKTNPKSCVTCVGNQYDKMENGKPEHMVWKDPRVKGGKTFYEIPPYDLELCIASLPKEGIVEVGGMDEKFDKFPAWSEKELACRMAAVGYKCYIDESLEYRAIHHPRLNEKWDKKYPESTAYFQKCYKEIQEGKRKRVDYLS